MSMEVHGPAAARAITFAGATVKIGAVPVLVPDAPWDAGMTLADFLTTTVRFTTFEPGITEVDGFTLGFVLGC